MFVPVFLMDYFLPVNIWILFAEIGVGIAVYFIALLALKTEFVYTYLRVLKNATIGKLKRKRSSSEQGTEEEDDK